MNAEINQHEQFADASRLRAASSPPGRNFLHRAIGGGLALFFLVASAASAQSGADAIIGIWLTATEDGYIQIYGTDGIYRGRIVGAPDGGRRKDANNPDAAKRDEPLLGKHILNGLEYDGEGTWKDGAIYDPNNGKTYNVRLRLDDPDTLELRGYVGIPLFGRTEEWTRVGKDAPGIVKRELIGDPARE